MKQILDERQIFTKNQIGNQSFLLLAYLLFIDAGLYGFGIRWLAYPANNIVILMACLFIYIIRLIRASSYAAPGKAKKQTYLVLAAIGTAAAIAAMVIILFNQDNGASAPGNDAGGIILFIVSVVMLAIMGIVILVKKHQNKGD